jgi:hypothetical protein
MTLANDYTTIKVATADYLGWGRNTEGAGTAWDAQTTYRLDAIIKAGLTQVYYPASGYQWSWLRPATSLTTSEPYDTGTIEIVASVVTLIGGTFPSWAASGDLEVQGETYVVLTRNGNTQLTLKETGIDVDAGAEYTLSRYVYDLPSDFAGFDGEITFPQSQSTLGQSIPLVSDAMVRRERMRCWGTGTPRLAAMRPKALDASAGQVWQLVLFPTPDQAYDLLFRSKVVPSMLTDEDPYPYGGPDVGELIVESCLSVAEQRYRDAADIHTQLFTAKLAAAIEQDARSFSPDTLGYNSDSSDGKRPDRLDGAAIHSFNGNYYFD